MAKIISESIVITFSKMVKDDHPDDLILLGSDFSQTLEQVAQELVGETVIVEVVRS